MSNTDQRSVLCDNEVYRSVSQLMHVFKLTDENVVSILNLAKDYEIKKLLEACDRYFFEKLEPSERNEDFMEYMTLTERFGLVYAKELAMNHLSRLTMKDLKRLCDSMGVTTRVMGEIFERRLELLDSGCLAPENANLPVSDVTMYFIGIMFNTLRLRQNAFSWIKCINFA